MNLLSNNFTNVEIENKVFKIEILKDYPVDNEWEECKKVLISFYEALKKEKEEKNICYFFDIRKLGILNYKLVNEIVSVFKEYKPISDIHIKGTAIVVNNEIIKNTINFFIKILSTPRPIKFLSERKEAFEFINTL